MPELQKRNDDRTLKRNAAFEPILVANVTTREKDTTSIEDDIFRVHYTERELKYTLDLQIQPSQLLRRRKAKLRYPLRRRINMPSQRGSVKQFLKERARRETKPNAKKLGRMISIRMRMRMGACKKAVGQLD